MESRDWQRWLAVGTSLVIAAWLPGCSDDGETPDPPTQARAVQAAAETVAPEHTETVRSPDDTGAPVAASPVEGIYEVTSHLENRAACKPGGESRMGAGVDAYLVVSTQPFLDGTYLNMTSCAAPAACRAKLESMAREEGWDEDFGFALRRADVDGTWTGEEASTGFQKDDTCADADVSTNSAVLEGRTLTVTVETTTVDYPAAGGRCSSERTRQAAAGKACSRVEVLTATLVEGLPPG